MRGDRLGFRDIYEVPGCAWLQGHTLCVVNCWEAGRKPNSGMVHRHIGAMCDAAAEPRRIRISIGYSARRQHGQDGIHGLGSGGAHGMRGNRLGLGHISEMQGGAGRAGIEAGGGDGWGAIRERDAGVVHRHAELERSAGREPTSHWIEIGRAHV